MNHTTPLASCLCVTERRKEFMPWLIWCFDRQRWSHRELVVIDSSPQPLQVQDRDDIRVVVAEPGTGIAGKRNMAIQEAQGEIITWFDDDDWQHPNKLEWLVDGMEQGAPYCGSCRAWFVNLIQDGCLSFKSSTKSIIFNSAGFRKDAIGGIRFPESLQKASDTRWMRAVEQRYPKQHRILKHDVLFFWLCHGHNISNPAKNRRFTKPLRDLKNLVGADGWGDTDDALEALRERLHHPAQKARGNRATRSGSLRWRNAPVNQHCIKTEVHENNSLKNQTALPAVSLMIKATVMDAAYLDTMVRHMVSQARFEFDERVIIVDRSLSSSGKYLHRSRTSDRELDHILQKLIADGVVHRAVDVDYEAATTKTIMRRYFDQHYDRIPLHAATGGPIYATLFGLESMRNRHVLQMDADIFFFTAGTSWVAESLKCMDQDKNLWLMMTHPGPPAGPMGASLGPRNTRLAQWDRNLAIWRFKTATTRYFLCNKDNLKARLKPLWMGSAMAPLEQIISRCLQQHGACRGALGKLTSWHLHAWHHGEPFPQWVKSLARSIETGRYPAFQGGQYDLRLDIPRDRLEWKQMIQSAKPKGVVDASVPMNNSTRVLNLKKKKVTGVTSSDRSPVTVIIPVRDRAGQRLKNTLTSLKWQDAGPPAQVILISHGSEPQINSELSDICAGFGFKLISIGDPDDPWNKPFALNVGIRASDAQIPFVMTMDADMILAPNFLSIVQERLKRNKAALILCRSSDLPQHLSLPETAEDLRRAYSAFKKQCSLRPQWGPGGIQAARRSFFFEIHGYDEELLWWGAMDKDMVQRAKMAGLAIEWIETHTTMLHQWHPRKHKILSDAASVSQAKLAWQHNHDLVRQRAAIMMRNPNGWGEMLN